MGVFIPNDKLRYLGSRVIDAINAASGERGDLFVVTSSGVLTSSGMTVNIGDFAAHDGVVWRRAALDDDGATLMMTDAESAERDANVRRFVEMLSRPRNHARAIFADVAKQGAA